MMTIRKWAQPLALLFFVFLLVSRPARADLLGSTVSWQY